MHTRKDAESGGREGMTFTTSQVPAARPAKRDRRASVGPGQSSKGEADWGVHLPR